MQLNSQWQHSMEIVYVALFSLVLFLLSFIMLKRTYVKKEFCLGKDFESAMRVAKLMEGK